MSLWICQASYQRVPPSRNNLQLATLSHQLHAFRITWMAAAASWAIQVTSKARRALTHPFNIGRYKRHELMEFALSIDVVCHAVQRSFTESLPSLSGLSYADRYSRLNMELLGLCRLRSDLVLYDSILSNLATLQPEEYGNNFNIYISKFATRSSYWRSYDQFCLRIEICQHKSTLIWILFCVE